MEDDAWEVQHLRGSHALWTGFSRAAHDEVPLPELLSGAQLLAAAAPPPPAVVEAVAKAAPPAPAAPRPTEGDVVERTLAASREAPLPTAGTPAGAAPSGLSKLLRGDGAGDGGAGSGPRLAIIVYCPDAERTPLRVTVQDTASVSQVIVTALKLAAAKAVSGGDGAALDARFLWLLPDDAAASGGITRANAATSSLASATAALKGFDAREWELRMNDSGGEADLDFPALERSRPIRNFTVMERGEGSVFSKGGTQRVGGEYCLLGVQRATSQVATAPHTALPADAAALTTGVTPAVLRVYIFVPYPRGPKPVVVMVPFALRRQRAEAAARLQRRRASGRAASSAAHPHALVDDEYLSFDAGFDKGSSPAPNARDVLTVQDVLQYVIDLHRLPALTNSYILRMPINVVGDGGSRLAGVTPERDELGSDVNLATAEYESGLEMTRKLYLDTPDGIRITVVAPFGQAAEAKAAAAAAPSSAAWRGGPRGTDSDYSAYENDDSVEGGGGGRAGGGRREYAAGAGRYGVGAVGAYRDTEGPLGYGAAGGGDLGSQLSYPTGPPSFMTWGHVPISAEGGEGRSRRSWGLGSAKAAPAVKPASARDIGSIVYTEEWTLTKVNTRGRRQIRVLGFDKTRVIMRKPDQEGGEKVRLLADLLRLEMPEGNPTLFTLVFKPGPPEVMPVAGGAGGVSSGLRALGRSLSGIMRQPPAAPKPPEPGAPPAAPIPEFARITYEAHSAADREAILLRMFTLLDIVKVGGPWAARL